MRKKGVVEYSVDFPLVAVSGFVVGLAAFDWVLDAIYSVTVGLQLPLLLADVAENLHFHVLYDAFLSTVYIIRNNDITLKTTLRHNKKYWLHEIALEIRTCPLGFGAGFPLLF